MTLEKKKNENLLFPDEFILHSREKRVEKEVEVEKERRNGRKGEEGRKRTFSLRVRRVAVMSANRDWLLEASASLSPISRLMNSTGFTSESSMSERNQKKMKRKKEGRRRRAAFMGTKQWSRLILALVVVSGVGFVWLMTIILRWGCHRGHHDEAVSSLSEKRLS